MDAQSHFPGIMDSMVSTNDDAQNLSSRFFPICGPMQL